MYYDIVYSYFFYMNIHFFVYKVESMRFGLRFIQYVYVVITSDSGSKPLPRSVQILRSLGLLSIVLGIALIVIGAVLQGIDGDSCDVAPKISVTVLGSGVWAGITVCLIIINNLSSIIIIQHSLFVLQLKVSLANLF